MTYAVDWEAMGREQDRLEDERLEAREREAEEQDIPFPDSKSPAKPRAFSSTAQTLKWARGIWGEESVTTSSWWQAAVGEGEADTLERILSACSDVLDAGYGPSAKQAFLREVRRRTGTGRRSFGVRKDLYGFIDCVVLDGQPGLLALQASGADVQEHIRKMAGEVRRGITGPKLLKAQIDAAKLAGRVRRWLAAGNRLVLVSWREVWVKTSEKRQVKKRAPRFLEAVLTEPPPGLNLGLSDREVEWIERETYPERRA